jgi:protein TonB
MGIVYGVSIAVHLGLAASVYSIRKTERREAIAVSMRETRRSKPKVDPPKPVEPKPMPEKALRRRLAAAPPRPAATPPPAPAEAPAPSALDSLPDLGLTLGGGVGGGGLPVANPNPRRELDRPARPKVLEAPAPAGDGCSEDIQKAKPLNIVQPTYASEEARAASIEGKVRIQITVGVDGTVVHAEVIQGLGYGLDEAALEAARASTFEPGTRCGKPVETTFTMGIRFSL